MSLSPTITHASEKVPGVKFTVHRIGFGRRTDIDHTTLAYRQRLRELEADWPPRSDKEKELAEQLEIAQRKAGMVPANETLAVIEADVLPLERELAAAAKREVKKSRAVIDEEYMTVNARVQAAWIRAGLVAIEGGELDGMTADELLAYGPPALAREIHNSLLDDGALRGNASKNLQPPTTSGEAAGGANQSTTAPPAEVLPAATTSNEIALSTSPGT